MRKVWNLLKQAGVEFAGEDPFTLAGALSYYTLLSIAPLLLIVVSLAGFFYGEEAARGEVMTQLETMMGGEAAGFVESTLAHAYTKGSTWFSAVVGALGLIFGATTAFGQLQSSLNRIWGVTAPKRPLPGVVRSRLLSFLFILLLGAAVIALLVASSVISALRGLPGIEALGFVWRLVDIAVPLAVMTAVFAALFKWMPDARVRWRDVWIGAAMTSLLFTIGRTLIGIYLGRAGVGSAYGAAGSAIVLMAWIYYSSLILLFGAEMTQVYARLYGGDVRSLDAAPAGTASTKGHALKDSQAPDPSPRARRPEAPPAEELPAGVPSRHVAH